MPELFKGSTIRLGECDFALAGGVSESIRAYGIFAGFKSQGALASHSDPTKASRPFDKDRNGIVVSEGGCIYVLERLEDAQEEDLTLLLRSPVIGSIQMVRTMSCPTLKGRKSV